MLRVMLVKHDCDSCYAETVLIWAIWLVVGKYVRNLSGEYSFNVHLVLNLNNNLTHESSLVVGGAHDLDAWMRKFQLKLIGICNLFPLSLSLSESEGS